MNIKFVDPYSLLLGLGSFAILILGLFHFDNTVAQKRALMIQISQYQPGDQVEYMRATVSGWTEEGMLILHDFVGAEIITDMKDNSFHLGNLVVLKGKIGVNHLFEVDTIEAYPGITMKIVLSLLVALVLFWKLLGQVKISLQGLILPPQNN